MSLDDKVTEMALSLRDCLLTELSLRDNPPADTCFIAGEDGRLMLSVGTSEDRCCAGFAWVRVATVSPIIPNIQDGPGVTTGNCGVWSWQVDYEMGVARCSPFGTTASGPSCEQLTAVAVQVQSDAEAMRAALCCFRPQIETGRSIPTPWIPFGPDGGCTGGLAGVSIQIDNCDCAD